ncbi:hypothetical protein [Streptomyces sulfonofaciens]|nr:hypothetical protein [Streptomyces sulfonofaciens]
MATDAWQQVREAVVAWWRRVRADGADSLESELAALRDGVVAARDQGDRDTEEALAAVWRLRFQQLLVQQPGTAAGLRALLDEHLLPALPPAEGSEARSVRMRAEAHDSARVYMAARDQHITGS